MPRLGVGWLVGSLGLGRIVGQPWDAFWDAPRILLKGGLSDVSWGRCGEGRSG
jgi:hypothetical protein